MKLTTRCKTCKTEVSFVSSVNDRVELEMQKGKVIPLTCKNDGHKHKYHVNELRAEKSLFDRIQLYAIPLLLILTIIYLEMQVFSLGYIFYGGIFLGPSIAFGIMNKQLSTKLNSFNRFKVKE